MSAEQVHQIHQVPGAPGGRRQIADRALSHHDAVRAGKVDARERQAICQIGCQALRGVAAAVDGVPPLMVIPAGSAT